jgi:hypothetical protein
VSAVASASILSIGGFPLDSFTYEVYFESIRFIEDFELKVKGDEKTYGDVVAYASSNISKSFEITGYNKTLNFISRLPVLAVNGTVTITWKGESIEIYDIQNAQNKSTYGNDIYIIELKFKQKDYLQSYNNI